MMLSMGMPLPQPPTGMAVVGTGPMAPPAANMAPAGQPPGGQPAHPSSGDVGEVRFDTPGAAQQALQMHGTLLKGSQISVALDPKSKDQTKIVVHNIGPRVEWQELKDHFKPCGTVAHANVIKKSGTPSVGHVRFETPEEAAQAVQRLNGTLMDGLQLAVKLHPASKDGTKVHVSNVPPGARWQELKDFFGQIGKVIHAETISAKPGVEFTGEVRYEDPQHAQLALRSLNGTYLGPAQIFVQTDQRSQDGSKLTVTGIAPGTEWTELKDHFASVGPVAFAQVHQSPTFKGFGKGFGKGKGSINFSAFAGLAALGKGSGGKGQKSVATAPGSVMGEVRYDVPVCAQAAVAMLNGTTLRGYTIAVDWDWNSSDGSKVWVGGLAPETSWQELKDHFAQCGQVAFANVKAKKLD